MSQRALRGRTVYILSEEMDLGSREKSADLEELNIERVRPEVDEANNETASQSVVAAEVPNLQIDSSDKDYSKGDETQSSEMTMMMNMMQQLLQRLDQQFRELKEGQKKSDQQFEGLEERIKQAQEKTGQKMEELKEGLQKTLVRYY
jgi:DNA anti-recombination protein RmuC